MRCPRAAVTGHGGYGMPRGAGQWLRAGTRCAEHGPAVNEAPRGRGGAQAGVAQGQGTGGDSGAAGSRGGRAEPRAAAGAAARAAEEQRETARGYRERHTPRRAGPHGAAPRRPFVPLGGGAGQGELGAAEVAPRWLWPRPGRSRRGPGVAPLPSSASKIACAILERRQQRSRQGAPAARQGPTARERRERPRPGGILFNSGRGTAALPQTAQTRRGPPRGRPCPVRASGAAAAATAPGP